MSYNPTPGADIRVSYDNRLGLYTIQQERTRTANGTTDPNDLGSILDLDQEGWETRFQTNIVFDLLSEVFNIVYTENVVMRSIDLGPTSLLSPAVVGSMARLTLLTF